MPSLLGTTVATNYLRVNGPNYTESGQARTYTGPFSAFGTRELAFYKVTSTGVHTGYLLANSLFEKCIKGIQQNAEIYFVGTPASDNFVFAIASDTGTNVVSGNNSAAQTIQSAVRATSADSGATVTSLTASGASIA